MDTLWSPNSPAQLQPPMADIAARPEMARTKVDQTLEPTHRIKFKGSDRIAHVSFSPDGHTAYCLVPAQHIDLWALGRQWWPELLGGALTLLVLAYLLVLLRVLRRPQIRGTPHCRKCNYDVSVQAPESALPRGAGGRRHAAPGTLCPECGTDLSRKRPRRGRSFSRRVLVPTALLALSAAAYIGLHIARVPRTGPPNSGPAVWSSWVDDFAEQHQLAAILKHKTHVAQIIRVDTRTGTILGTLRTLRGYPAGDMRVSPDGRFIAVVGDKTTLLWIRTSNGRTVAQTTGGEFRGGGVYFVHGFSGPVAAPWVYYAAVDHATGTSRLLRWRPADGAQQIVVEEPAHQVAYANNMKAYEARRYVLLHRPDGVATMSAPSFMEAFETNRAELLVRGDVEHGSEITRAIPARDSLLSMSPLVPSPDGQLLFLRTTSGGVIGIDLRTGETMYTVRPDLIQSPYPQFDISADGERLLISMSHNSVLVRDITQKRWIAELQLPLEFMAPTPSASLDGRWLAVIAFEASGSVRAASQKKELFLYDVSTLGKEPAGDSPTDNADERP